MEIHVFGIGDIEMNSVSPSIRVDGEDVPVTDPHHIVPVCAELITDIRVIDGTLFLSLASHVMDGTGPAEARVVSRLRMPLGVVSSINAALQNIQAGIEQAKKAAN